LVCISSEIEHVAQQQLQVTVFDSDRGEEPSMKAILQEKRGFTKKIQGIRTLFSSGQIVDDFLGQITLNIKVYSIKKIFVLKNKNVSLVTSNS